jgi:hypothetical protein
LAKRWFIEKNPRHLGQQGSRQRNAFANGVWQKIDWFILQLLQSQRRSDLASPLGERGLHLIQVLG